MSMFHSLMQQFLPAESGFNFGLWKIGFTALKPLLYQHSDLLLG